MTLTLLIIGYVLSVIATRKVTQFNFFNPKGLDYNNGPVPISALFWTFVPVFNAIMCVTLLIVNIFKNKFNPTGETFTEWFFKPRK